MSDMQEVRKEVKISGIKEDNIWMELVDWAGRIRYFHVEIYFKERGLRISFFICDFFR